MLDTATEMAQETLVLTVSQLTQAIKFQLEDNFVGVRLQGEISNCKLQSSGHLYFSLKDAQAQIAAVMFKGHASKLKRVPRDGDKVIVEGDLNVYPPTGKYQIVVREVSLQGLGERLLQLEELKQTLLQRGWFKKSRKRPLPKFPKVIGVVTSPTGAVIQDIINILKRRFSGFHLILNPVKVQGEGAAEEIAKAIRQFNDYQLVDVMIVGRGGGSFEDLWEFNQEIVAQAIFESHIPIIAAVGHETDHCIAEYVADVRAPTPSAAAELVIAEKAQQLDFLTQAAQRIRQTLLHLVARQRQQLQSLIRQPILRSPYPLLGPWMQKLDDLKGRLDQQISHQLQKKQLVLQSKKSHLESLRPGAQIHHYRQKLQQFARSLHHVLFTLVHRSQEKIQRQQNELEKTWTRSYLLKKERLEQLVHILQAIDPKNLLNKGYSILLSDNKETVITSVSALEKKQSVRILLSDGEAGATIKEIISK